MSKDFREFCETAFIAFTLIALAAVIADWTNASKHSDLVFNISILLALLANIVYSKFKFYEYLGLWTIFLSATVLSVFVDGPAQLGISLAGITAAVLMLHFSDTKQAINRFRR